MKSFSHIATATAALALLTSSSAAIIPVASEQLVERDGLNALTYMGCFASDTGLKHNDTDTYQSSGHCQVRCAGINMPVQAMTNANECWCGETLPPQDSLQSDDSSCNLNCKGYPSDTCGGKKGGTTYFTVWLTGTEQEAAVEYAEDTKNSTSPASAASSTTSAPATVVTVESGATVTVPVESAAANKNSSGPSKAGIAAGVVVGILAAAAIAGAIFMFIRSRKRRELEEEYKRNAQINSFVAGGKSSSSTAPSFNDTRLDPAVMANRRMSDGSIADNQDYSRRILKVTNA